MKNVILVFLVTLLTTASGTGLHEHRDEADSGVFEFQLIGTADGVSFFYERTGRTWAAAKTYCESSGMHLAKISTKAQLDMLTTSVLLPNGVYWTSGRDADEIRQFSWDDTKAPIPDLLEVNYDSSVSTHLSCLYAIKSANSLRLKSITCNANPHTLCVT